MSEEPPSIPTDIPNTPLVQDAAWQHLSQGQKDLIEDPQNIIPSPEEFEKIRHGEAKPPLTAEDAFYQHSYQVARRFIDKVESTRVLQETKDEAERKLKYVETHDTLTGLLNRTGIERAITERIETSANLGFGVIFVDLNKFKSINDLLGHHEGDEALIEVGKRIRAVLRGGNGHPGDEIAHTGTPYHALNADSPEEQSEAARLGGDEYVALVDLEHHREDDEDNKMSPRKRLEKVEGRICAVIEDFMAELIDKHGEAHPKLKTIGLGVATGAVVYSLGMSTDDIIRDADNQMYADKPPSNR